MADGYANALTAYNRELAAAANGRGSLAGGARGAGQDAAPGKALRAFPSALLFREDEKPLQLKCRLNAFFERNYQRKIAPPNYWQDAANRIAWVRELVKCTGKGPRGLTEGDFHANGLSRACIVLGGAYNAVNEAYPELGIVPWEMPRVPKHYFKSKENRVAAVRWMVEKKLGCCPKAASTKDFRNYGISGVLDFHHDVVHAAISEAYPELGIRKWEMGKASNGFFNSLENRRAVLEWILRERANGEGNRTAEETRALATLKSDPAVLTSQDWKLINRLRSKDPRDLGSRDFEATGQQHLLSIYGGSPYRVVSALMPESGIMQWEMGCVGAGFFGKKENRKAAIKWLVEVKLKCDPRDMTAPLFSKNRLGGLLRDHYNSSPCLAVQEAYPEQGIAPWEMSKAPRGFFADPANRGRAVAWLAEKLGKPICRLTAKDISCGGYSQVLKLSGGPSGAKAEAEECLCSMRLPNFFKSPRP